MIKNIATILVDQLVELGIKHVFCVPGASIDTITTAIKHNSKVELVLCRQETNAGFMATAYAKRTGRPAVVLVTAGPGATNVVTASVTATMEHTPLIIISGQMDSATTFKPSHQVINAESLFVTVTKYSKEITNSNNVVSALCLAYAKAVTGEKGAVHLAFAADLLSQKNNVKTVLSKPVMSKSIATDLQLTQASKLIMGSNFPIIIVGKDASSKEISYELNKLINKNKLSVIATFEAGGLINKENISFFMGRLGVFQNQPCDTILSKADLIITIGYNIAELDPLKWNANNQAILHISEYLPVIATAYNPQSLLIGDIALNIEKLTNLISRNNDKEYVSLQEKIRNQLKNRLYDYTKKDDCIHPLEVVSILQENIASTDIVVSDVGSHQYWMAEYFVSHTPCQFINSMGFQTLGVSLPYAIGSSIAEDKNRVFSISGDGGILMCIMELATAVENNIPLISLIWKDHSYNLVAVQEENKFQEESAVDFKHDVDFVKIAEGLGAIGFSAKNATEFNSILAKAKSYNQPVVIQLNINYEDNLKRIIL